MNKLKIEVTDYDISNGRPDNRCHFAIAITARRAGLQSEVARQRLASIWAVAMWRPA